MNTIKKIFGTRAVTAYTLFGALTVCVLTCYGMFHIIYNMYCGDAKTPADILICKALTLSFVLMTYTVATLTIIALALLIIVHNLLNRPEEVSIYSSMSRI